MAQRCKLVKTPPPRASSKHHYPALVNKHFCTSVLDIRVYRSTFHESDHKHALSTLRFKIKAKHRHTGIPRYQTTNVSTSHQAGYQSVLAESFDDDLEQMSNATRRRTQKPVSREHKDILEVDESERGLPGFLQRRRAMFEAVKSFRYFPNRIHQLLSAGISVCARC